MAEYKFRFKTVCEHNFCSACLQQALNYQNKCPVCRKINPIEEDQYEQLIVLSAYTEQLNFLKDKFSGESYPAELMSLEPELPFISVLNGHGLPDPINDEFTQIQRLVQSAQVHSHLFTIKRLQARNRLARFKTIIEEGIQDLSDQEDS